MVPVQQAVAAATAFAQQVLEPERRANLVLEEVELSTKDGRDVWLITLSMFRPQLTATSAISQALGLGPRDYKSFVVDAQTGEVLAMKIREVAA